MAGATVHIFVAGHTDEMLSSVPDGDEFEAVDLRSLTLESQFATNALAESRFLVSNEARNVRTDYIGFCSANYDKKFPAPPHLGELPGVIPYLRPHDAIGPFLSSNWRTVSDALHPGMGPLLERVATEFGQTVLPVPVPFGNTFVCRRDEWFRLLDAFHSMITVAFKWYGMEPPYRYRCLRCGTLSDTGYGRYTHERHLGYFAERLTMQHFASQPDAHFVTPTAVRLRTSPVLRVRASLHSKLKRRGVRFPRPHLVPSITALDGPPCPGCPAS
jgi:hypothetical protein